MDTQNKSDSRENRASGSQQRLVRHGFVQGKRNGMQSGECNGCEKTVTQNRSWWWRVSYEYDEWDCYCKKCALEKVDADESMWADYASDLPNA